MHCCIKIVVILLFAFLLYKRATYASTLRECFLKESIEKSKACNGRTVVIFNILCMQLTGRDFRDR